MDKSKILSDVLQNMDGTISTTKSITVFGVLMGALILAYCAYKNVPDLWLMFGIFMSTTCGLTVTKGVFSKGTTTEVK